jgi:hypothetical protein
MSPVSAIEALPFFFEVVLVHVSIYAINLCEFGWINLHWYCFIIRVTSEPIVPWAFYPLVFLCLWVHESLPVYVLLSLLLGSFNPLFKGSRQSFAVQDGILQSSFEPSGKVMNGHSVIKLVISLTSKVLKHCDICVKIITSRLEVHQCHIGILCSGCICECSSKGGTKLCLKDFSIISNWILCPCNFIMQCNNLIISPVVD